MIFFAIETNSFIIYDNHLHVLTNCIRICFIQMFHLRLRLIHRKTKTLFPSILLLLISNFN